MSGIFKFIVNPQTGRRVHVNGKIGKQVLNNYLYQLDAIRSGSQVQVKKGKTTSPKKFKAVGVRVTKPRKNPQ